MNRLARWAAHFMHQKEDWELDRLRRSADLVSRTLAEVAPHVRPGATLAELDAAAEAFIRDHGARPAFKGYDPGWGGGPFPGTCCISVNEVVVHGIPGDYRLEEGDVVTVDVGVELDGYYGDTAYTFAVGEISAAKRHLLRVTFESLLLGADQAIAGQRVGDIGHAVQQHCEREGLGVVRELVGHSIGRKLHEGLSVPNFGRRGTGAKLRAGMTLCIEPMITAGTYEVVTSKDGWTIRTADGAPAAHYEHMVHIRSGGPPEVLTSFGPVEAVVDAPYREVTYGEAEGD